MIPVRSVEVLPDNRGVRLVIGCVDGTDLAYEYLGVVETTLHQRHYDTVSVTVSVTPRSETGGRQSPPNAPLF